MAWPPVAGKPYIPTPGGNGGNGTGHGGYGSYGNYGGGYALERMHLWDYARVIYRRRWAAFAAFALVVVASALSFTTGPPIYEARAQMLIERETPSVASIHELEQSAVSYTEEAYYQTQFKMLQSRTLARRTLTALSLWDKPPFGGHLAANAPRSSPGLRVMVHSAIGSAWSWTTWPIRKVFGGGESTKSTAQTAAPDETATEARAINVFLSGLTITPVRNSRLVDVKYQSEDRELPALIANGLTKEYIAQNLEFRFLSSKDATDWLAQRMEEQRRQVEASEQALQQYREHHNAVSLDERQNIVVQKLSDLNVAVTKAKTDRIQREALYQQVLAAQKNGMALDAVPAVMANSFVQQLKGQIASLQQQQAQMNEKWGEKHPEMVRVQTEIRSAQEKLQAETAKVVQGLQSDYQAALSQEQSLTQLLEAQKREALAMNSEAIGYGVLQRDAATNRQLFDALLQQTKETGISQELKATNIRVVDPAERPTTPVGPSSQTNWMLALLGATILAVGTALFFEYLDNRVKLPEEIETRLGLPFLGLVPVVPMPKNADKERVLLVDERVPSHFLEALRIIRTNVLFSSTAEGGKSLLVTSAAPGEGKTLVAANLAISLAQSGQRVLLVDGDMRRPRQHTIFGLDQDPGLSNLLVGGARPSAAVRPTTVPGLWLLPCGQTPPNPAELLGSTRFKELLDVLASSFDWVIIDSPPVMAVADASVLANRVSRVLFIVGAEMTSRPAAARAIQQLLRANGKFAGAILNKVPVDRHRYYYRYYYRREYSGYYGNGNGHGSPSHRPQEPPTRSDPTSLGL